MRCIFIAGFISFMYTYPRKYHGESYHNGKSFWNLDSEHPWVDGRQNNHAGAMSVRPLRAPPRTNHNSLLKQILPSFPPGFQAIPCSQEKALWKKIRTCWFLRLTFGMQTLVSFPLASLLASMKRTFWRANASSSFTSSSLHC